MADTADSTPSDGVSSATRDAQLEAERLIVACMSSATTYDAQETAALARRVAHNVPVLRWLESHVCNKNSQVKGVSALLIDVDGPVPVLEDIKWKLKKGERITIPHRIPVAQLLMMLGKNSTAITLDDNMELWGGVKVLCFIHDNAARSAPDSTTRLPWWRRILIAVNPSPAAVGVYASILVYAALVIANKWK